MNKKLIIILLLITTFIAGCGKSKTDGAKFMEEYTSINGEKTESGKTIRSLNITKNNPFVYQTAEDLVEKIEAKESFIVYFGFPKCPWCRSILEELIKVAKDKKVKTIYYVNVLDIRDTKTVEDDGTVTTAKEGTEAYMKLLEYLGDVLEDYSLTKDGESISAGEKRIYAPNIVAVHDGKPIQMETGISDELTDPYGELTTEIKEYAYNSFKCLIECLQKESTTCQKNMC